MVHLTAQRGKAVAQALELHIISGNREIGYTYQLVRPDYAGTQRYIKQAGRMQGITDISLILREYSYTAVTLHVLNAMDSYSALAFDAHSVDTFATIASRFACTLVTVRS